MQQQQPSLFNASSKGNLNTVKDILRHAANAQVDIIEKKNVALLGASMYGHERIVDVLIKNGSDVNYSNADRHTALHWAAYRGHSNVVDILLSYGAEVDKADKDGNTALMFASSKGFEHIVRILLEFNASVHARNRLNETALHVACLGSDNPVIVQFLIKFGARLNISGRNDWTPLHYCSEYNRPLSTKILLEAGANPCLTDNIKDTPLDILEDKEVHGDNPVHQMLVEATDEWEDEVPDMNDPNYPIPPHPPQPRTRDDPLLPPVPPTASTTIDDDKVDRKSADVRAPNDAMDKPSI